MLFELAEFCFAPASVRGQSGSHFFDMRIHKNRVYGPYIEVPARCAVKRSEPVPISRSPLGAP
jgi:hypothetical protein